MNRVTLRLLSLALMLGLNVLLDKYDQRMTDLELDVEELEAERDDLEQERDELRDDLEHRGQFDNDFPLTPES